jgi:3-deoxy-D-manno-octulosonate 8-phosphate phosphatase (KDO 8-P phosphatase)
VPRPSLESPGSCGVPPCTFCTIAAVFWDGRLAKITLLILDVDGVLTDGVLPYDGSGDREKAFYVQDGGAVRLWQAAGGAVAIISGRESPAVVKRAGDLGIRFVRQGVANKLPVYEALCREIGADDRQVSFIGDDLLDIPPMRRCGYPIAVANAVPMVKRVARYITQRHGGKGAVAEAVARLLRHNGTWAEAMAPFGLDHKVRA